MKEPAKEKIKKIFALAPFFSANTAFFQPDGQYSPVPSMDGFKAGKSMAELHVQEPFFASERHLPEAEQNIYMYLLLLMQQIQIMRGAFLCAYKKRMSLRFA